MSPDSFIDAKSPVDWRVRAVAIFYAALFILVGAFIIRLGLVPRINTYALAIGFAILSYAPQTAYASSWRALLLPLTHGTAPRWANWLSGLGTATFVAATVVVLLNR